MRLATAKCSPPLEWPGPGAAPTGRAGSVHSLHLRGLRVREEQAAIHRPFDHCVDAALCINGSKAQIPDLVKSGSPASLVVETWTPHLHIAARRRCNMQRLGLNS